jgi:hypothetical protein
VAVLLSFPWKVSDSLWSIILCSVVEFSAEVAEAVELLDEEVGDDVAVDEARADVAVGETRAVVAVAGRSCLGRAVCASR